jgi:hypothetical protein
MTDIREELSSLPPNWEPAPAEKQWQRNRMNGGDLGWLCRKDGKWYVRLNRPNENLRPYHARDWIAEKPPAELTIAGCAQITFAADKALCYGVGEYALSRRDWNLMQESAKLAWMKNGPKNDAGKHGDIRRFVYKILMDALEPLTR